MKKIIYLGLSAIFLLAWQAESRNKRVNVGNTMPSNKPDTIPLNARHLAFLNKDILEKIKKDDKKYLEFLKRFEPVPKDKFENYRDYFETIFQVGTANSPIQHFAPLPFSIYEMYNGFQYYLGRQVETFTEGAKTFKNKVRIYPAIGVTDKIFYLVFMGEKEEIAAMPPATSITDRNYYYTIKHYSPYGLMDVSFDMVPINEIKNVEADIKNFQTIWAGISDPQHTNYHFDPVSSFSYSIADYNELLGNTDPFWDLANFQTDPSPQKYIVAVPVIFNDDQQHLAFKLVFLPYKKNFWGNYIIDDSRGFFNHMDVCPDKCPSNSVK